MARIDVVCSESGTFRAPLAADRAGSSVVQGVGLDVNGRVVIGPGNTGFKGVICEQKDLVAGQPIDIIKDGEIVEFTGVAGTNYFADGASGALVAGTGARTETPPAAAGSKHIGHTVEGTRLVVAVGRVT